MEPEDVMTRNQGWTGETASVALRAWIERIVTEGTAGYFGQQPWQIEAVLDELDRYRAGVAASPSEEVEAALAAADRLADYVNFQGRSGHNWPTTAEAQRTYVTARRALLALRTTKEGRGG